MDPGCEICAYVVTIMLSIVVFVIFNSSTVTIQSGYVGIKSRLGKIQNEPVTEGLSFINPFFETVFQEDVKLWTVATTANAASKDLQTVMVEVSVQYVLKSDLVPTMFMKVGSRESLEPKIFQPALSEGIKQIIPQYTAENIIKYRDQVKQQIYNNIKSIVEQTLASDNLQDLIQFSNVAIRDFTFSAEFNNAIEKKVKTEQEALQALNEKKKQLVEAEAQAEQKEILSDAAAYAIKAEADAKANGLKLHAEALKAYQSTKNSGSYSDLEATKKWNGHLPEIYGEGSVSPLMNMNRKKREIKREAKRASNFIKGFFSHDPVTVAHRENFVSDYQPTKAEIDLFISKNFPFPA